MGNQALEMKWRFGLGRIDLDVSWRDVNYCTIDLETTGLDFQKDEIVSLGVAQIRQGRVVAEENLYREVHPINAPSLSSVKVHGLRQVDLEIAQPLESVLPELVAALEGRVVIAHAAWIEYAFLKKRIHKAGSRLSKNMVDTAALARRTGYAPEMNGKEPSLESLAKRMNLPVYSPHHALGDAMTTAVMFLALATEIERESIAKGSHQLSLRDLLEISRENSWRPSIRNRLTV
jgi:DNA polymerase-3 subunit epsilon